METEGPGVPPEPGVISLSSERRPTKCSRLVKKPGRLIATLDQTPSSFPARLSSRLRGNRSREVGELGQGHKARDAGHSDSGLGRPHLAVLGAPGGRKPGDTRASRLVSAEGPSAARVGSSDSSGQDGLAPRRASEQDVCVSHRYGFYQTQNNPGFSQHQQGQEELPDLRQSRENGAYPASSHCPPARPPLPVEQQPSSPSFPPPPPCRVGAPHLASHVLPEPSGRICLCL